MLKNPDFKRPSITIFLGNMLLIIMWFFPQCIFFSPHLFQPSYSQIFFLLVTVFLTLFLGPGFLSYLQSLRVHKRNVSLVRGFLSKFHECQITEYPLKSYIPAHILSEFGYVHLHDQAFPTSEIRIFAISRGQSKAVPSQLVAYRSSFQSIKSYIFVPDPPQETNIVQRFFVLHEAAHTQNAISFPLSISEYLVTFPWLWLFLLLPFAEIRVETITIFIGYALIIYLLNKYFRKNRSHLEDLEEIAADNLALFALSKANRLRLIESPIFQYLSTHRVEVHTSFGVSKEVINGDEQVLIMPSYLISIPLSISLLLLLFVLGNNTTLTTVRLIVFTLLVVAFYFHAIFSISMIGEECTKLDEILDKIDDITINDIKDFHDTYLTFSRLNPRELENWEL